MHQMLIPGSVGQLEAVVDVASSGTPQDVLAVLCHPHPQYGGSMYDGVLSIASDTLTGHGVACVRFNFRGVGASEGSFDSGVGEIDDLLAVVEWTATAHPHDRLWLIGYSFGASIVAGALDRLAAVRPVQRALLIAPPIGRLPFSATSAEGVHCIAGTADDFVDPGRLESWAGDQCTLIAGADHFFSSPQQQSELRQAVNRWSSGH